MGVPDELRRGEVGVEAVVGRDDSVEATQQLEILPWLSPEGLELVIVLVKQIQVPGEGATRPLTASEKGTSLSGTASVSSILGIL